MSDHPKIKRCFLASFFLGLMIFSLSGILFLTRPVIVQAQNPDVVAALNTIAVANNIKMTWKTILKLSVAQALTQAITIFFQRLAYNTAVWVASGGEGQEPLYSKQLWFDYLTQASQAAVGEFLGTFSDNLNIPGLDLCTPDLSVVLKLKIGIARRVKEPKPRCDFNDLKNNWDQFRDQITEREGQQKLLSQLGVSFEPNQSPLGVALELNRKALTRERKKEKAAEKEREEGKGFFGKKGLISGDIQTPAAVVEEKLKTDLIKNVTEPQKVAILGAYWHADTGWALLRTVLSTFASTLTNQLLSKVMGGLFTLGDLFKFDQDLELPELEGGFGGVEAARKTFADLLPVQIRSTDNYNALGQFTTCSTPRGPDHCVLDEQFAAAVRQAETGRILTLREAIEQGLVHGDWALIPSTDKARNQDPYCYTYAYCYSNLVKLRAARIIPIGWEIAAERSTNSDDTLEKVMNNFNNCDNQEPEQNKWCHLIDPNWVLKYPHTQCRAMVYGPTLISLESDQRAEVCVDTPSCVSENDQGECVGGWGYCTREKNVWRFDGDACPAYFNTCQSFQGPEDKELTVRTNTVDYGVCRADNAGCRWSSVAQDYLDTVGESDRVCVSGPNKGKACSLDDDCPGSSCLPDDSLPSPYPDKLEWRSTSRIYLNRQALVCDAANIGCTEVIPKEIRSDQEIKRVTLNLLRNPSFEDNTDQNSALPDFWSGNMTAYDTSASQAADGFDAVRLTANNAGLVQRVKINPRQFYAISVSGKRVATDASTVVLEVKPYGTDNAPLSTINLFSTCLNSNNTYSLNFIPPAAATDGSLSYDRQSCAFTSPANTAYILLTVKTNGPGVWVDSVQLEENEVTSDFAIGYGGPIEPIHLKVPPKGLCPGGENDPPICSQYAAVCSAQDVGCELYTPALGGPAVPGIAREPDQCPQSCVGYATYREEPTNFNPTGDFPLHFIAETARACSAINAGCDEFTNLEAATAEQRESFTYLRLCEEPTIGQDLGTFYTWEGTDQTGLQLRVWQLKKSQASLAAPGVNDSWKETDPSGGAAPCTNYQAVTNTCNDPIPWSPPDGCRVRADIFTNPDCREFYDEAGKIHYRLYSRTITKTEECTDYRKTIATQSACLASGGRWQATTAQCFYKAYRPENLSCPASENNCRLYTGNAGRNVRIIFEDNFEDGEVTGWGNGEISNESLAATGHSLRKSNGLAWVVHTIIDPAVTQTLPGRALRLAFWAKGTKDQQLQVRISNSPANRYFSYSDNDSTTPTVVLNESWQFFELGPVLVDWEIEPDFVFTTRTLNQNIANAELFLDEVTLSYAYENFVLIKNSWQTPPECDATPEGAYSAQEMLGCQEYKDRAGAPAYLKSFSRLCSEKAIGCQAFFDTQNSSSPYAESWNYICLKKTAPASGVCSIDPDGNGSQFGPVEVCTIPAGSDRCRFRWSEEIIDPNPANVHLSTNLKFIDGTETTAIYPFFYDESLTVAAADETVYLVDAPDKRCPPDARGCELLGQPKYNQDKSAVIGYDEVAKFNLPDNYPSTLCPAEALFCDDWRTPAGSEFYFKDPLDKQCEYLEAGPAGAFGWFKKGKRTCLLAQDCGLAVGCACPGAGQSVCQVAAGQKSCTYREACDPEFLIGGQEYGLWTNGSPNYDGWAGACRNEFSGCTEFLDPLDQGGESGFIQWPQGKPYDRIKNQKLDERQKPTAEQCQGQVSLKEGCVLLNDTSDSVMRWNSAATYEKSAAANFARVLPVDCVSPAPGDSQYCLNLNYNDTNLVLKVRRDRECARWLSCASPDPVFDERSGQWRTVCAALDECFEPAKIKDLGSCVYAPDAEPQVLLPGRYANRDISWFGFEYSGYSIPNQYSLQDLEPIDVGACVPETEGSAAVMIPENQTNKFGCRVETNQDCGDNEKCVSHFRLGRDLGACGPNLVSGASCQAAGQSGRCYNLQCAQDLKSRPLAITDQLAGPAAACRGYPEVASPLPTKVVTSWNNTGTSDFLLDDNPQTARLGFQNTKVCSNGQSCECSYRKLAYEDGSTRFTSQSNFGMEGICQDGSKKGQACAVDVDCQASGQPAEGFKCVRRTRSDRFVGLEGFCVQPDYSTNLNGDPNQYACNLWFPIDRIPGVPDIYNQFTSAGLEIPPGQEWYCADGAWGITGSGQAGGAAIELKNSELVIGLTSSKFYFGSPKHVFCNPELDDDSQAIQYSCISQKHWHSGSQLFESSCADAAGGTLCVWPQRYCGTDIGWESINQSTNGFCTKSTVGNATGPKNFVDNQFDHNGSNLIGCYGVATGAADNPADDWDGMKTSGLGTVRYPWIGPPVYKNQVDSFEIVFGDSLGIAWCHGASREFGPGRSYPFEPSTTKANVKPATNSGHKFGAYPLWGPGDDQLKAITIMMDEDDEDDMGVATIKYFIIKFHPACFVAANVGQGGTGSGSVAAYTDRVVGNHYDYPPPPTPPFDKNTIHEPWGAICGFDLDQQGLVLDSPEPLAAEACSINFTDAIYRDLGTTGPATLRSLFARSNSLKRFERWYDDRGLGSIGSTKRCAGGARNNQLCEETSECRYAGVCGRGCLGGLQEGRACDPGDANGISECTFQIDGWFLGPPRRCFACKANPTSVSDLSGCALANDSDNPDGFTCTNDDPNNNLFSSTCFDKLNEETSNSTCSASCWESGSAANGFVNHQPLIESCEVNGQLDQTVCNNQTAECTSLAGRDVDLSAYLGDIPQDFKGIENEDAFAAARSLTGYLYPFWQYVDLRNREIWNDGTDVYLFNQQTTPWDDTETADDASNLDLFPDDGVSGPPQVHPPLENSCQLDGTCLEQTKSGVMVNNQTLGDLKAKKQVRATMKFYMRASDNRLPITRLVVDWGDDEPQDRPGSFKNHRAECLTGSDAPFGQQTPAACDTQPMVVVHDYQCTAADLASLPPCVGGRPDHFTGYESSAYPGGCKDAGRCVFVPRVQVNDNWGWCSGSCPGNPGGEGCYSKINELDSECNLENPKSNNLNKDPWVYFAGRIVVEP